MQECETCEDPDTSVKKGGSLQRFKSSTYFTEGQNDLPRKAIELNGSKCFSSGSVSEFLRKPIATCDFPRSGLPVSPLDPPMGDGQHQAILSHV